MKVLFACGGTGGHIYPAIAIADIIKKKHPDTEMIFAGRKNGMENDLVTKNGYKMLYISAFGLKRKLSLKNLRALGGVLSSVRQARDILIREKPDAVIGTGGYVCFPLLWEAAKLKIPCAVHESNAKPGLSVRALSHRVNAVWLGTAAAKKELKRAVQIKVTGNPLRSTFLSVSYERARQQYGFAYDDFVILSFGGSLGSAAINSAVKECMMSFSDTRIRFVHICGQRYADQFEMSRHGRHRVYAYTSDLPRLMQASDLVISRSGAMTLTELAYCGKPAILIPSPNVTANHQYHNAVDAKMKGGALILEEKELCGDSLKETILSVYGSEARYAYLKSNASHYDPREVEKNISDAFEDLTNIVFSS